MTPEAMIQGSVIFLAIIVVVLPVLPFFWVLKKMGRSPWWGVLAFIPFANIVIFWVAAFWRWPSQEMPTYRMAAFD